MIDRIINLVEQRVIIPLLAFLLAFITIGVFTQVLLRYIFNTTFLWSEELSLYAFIWCVFLGAVVGVQRHIHLGFDILPEVLPPRIAAVQKLVVNLTILSVALLLFVEGANFAKLSVRTLSPALGISLLIPTIIIPISGALMIVCVLRDLSRDLRLIFPRRSA
jgi:TRAP-type C4-dicarboxylate transport system permease small subunit